MFRKSVVLFFCLAMVLSLSLASHASGDSNNRDLEERNAFDKMIPLEVQEAMAKQTPALEEYCRLIDFFAKDEFGVPVYPEYYAGEYIDENNKLVVQLTKEYSNKEVLSFLQNSPIIQIKYVKHSYNDLLSQKRIADELYADGFHVVFDGIDIIDNIYKIAVLKEDLDNALANYPDNPLVLFEVGTYAQPAYNLIGGDRMYNYDTGIPMSLGICGAYDGSNALLTCGHGNEDVGGLQPHPPYIQHKLQNHLIGQVVFQQANTVPNNTGVSSLGDFAIVEITSSDTLTNDVWMGGDITGTYSSVPVGTILYKFGASAGYSWGSVTHCGVRIAYSNGFLNYVVGGLYRVTVQNSSGTPAIASGDSGGPVWRSDTGENLLHGIVTANTPDKTAMYTTPIYYPVYQGFQPKLD